MNPYIRSEDETEIDLLDLAKYLLRRVLWILLAGIVCAGIVAALKYVRTRSQNADPKAAVSAETEYALDLELYEKESELIHASDESALELITKQEDYLSSSPYMQIDPYHVWKAQAMIQVTSRSKDFPAYQVEEMYKFRLANVDYLEKIAKERGTEAAYLREMISTWSLGSPQGTGDSTSDVILRDEDYEERKTSKIFAAQAIGDTREHANELLDEMLGEAKAVYLDTKSAYPHQMKVISTVCSETVDMGIRNAQRDLQAYVQTLLTQIKDNKDKAAALTMPEPSVQAQGGSVSKKDLLKFGLIGFVIGVLLMCVVFAVRYIRNDRLVDYKDIERKGLVLKDLGSMSAQGVEVVAANIRNFAADKKKLFLTGMASDAEFGNTCSSLKGTLGDYEVVYARNVLDDSKAKEMLLDCDAAVLVEQKGTTLYSGMRQEITFLVNAGKEVVGVVID